MSLLPESLHLLRPLGLLLLLLLPLLWWAIARQQREAGDWSRACDPHLLPHLLEPSQGRASRAPQWLASAVLVVAALALAGPAWERLPEPLHRNDAALVIVLDLSDSVRAGDLRPDRLTRARFKLADLFRLRPDGQLALVVYAGDAFTVAPLTDDSNTIANLVEALDPSLLPVAGKRTDLALRHAAGLLRGAGVEGGELLLLTDSSGARDRDVATELAAAGIRLSVLGLGGEAPAPIPQAGGGFLLDSQGRPVLARLDAASLRELAAAGGGHFAAFSNDRSDLVSLGMDRVTPASLRQSSGEAMRYRDAGYWLLIPLAILALFSFRRGWLALLLVLPMGVPQPAQAFEWRDLWQRRDQQAAAALQDGDAERARALARDPELRGAAAYRLDDWQAATEAFAERDNAVAHYNRGNALARSGAYQEAIDAYRTALQRQPDLEDAKANLDAVLEWLERQPSSPQQGEGQSDEQGDTDESEPSEGDAARDEQGEQSEPQEGERSESDEDGERSQDQSGQQDPAGEEGQDESGAQPEPGDEQAPDADADEAAQRALSEAIDQALAEQEQASPPELGQAPSPEEQAEAERRQSVEQWLRRVPDDPGALLRRKFALEHQRRQREGNR